MCFQWCVFIYMNLWCFLKKKSLLTTYVIWNWSLETCIEQHVLKCYWMFTNNLYEWKWLKYYSHYLRNFYIQTIISRFEIEIWFRTHIYIYGFELDSDSHFWVRFELWFSQIWVHISNINMNTKNINIKE